MNLPTSTAHPAERWVTCPTCKGPSRYASSNVYRPFCSERCQQIDLGAWASEQFAVPTPVDSALTDND